jgi:hypothetical protein
MLRRLKKFSGVATQPTPLLGAPLRLTATAHGHASETGYRALSIRL